jgi:tetratricopeptide (TPR) repeat protein
MAPEQALEESEGDYRIDIYAAGLVMYEMLSGRSPFSGMSVSETIVAQRTRVPPDFARQDLPSPLSHLVKQCIEKDPRARPSSVESILNQLDGMSARHVRVGNRRFVLIAASIIAAIGLLSAGAFTLLDAPAPLRGASRTVNAAVDRPSVDLESRLRGNRLASTPGRHTPNVAAYEWYARGMDVSLMRTSAGAQRGIEYFKRAIEADPEFAAAYAGLSRLYLQFGNNNPNRREWFARAESAGVKAVALDDSLAEAHIGLGWALLATGKMERAESELKTAAALNPSAPQLHEGLARLYMQMGRTSEQLAEARQGVADDPFSHSAIRELALALNMNKRCDESLRILAPLKALSPPAGVAGIISGQCYAYKKMWPEAIAEFQWTLDNAKSSVAPAFLAYALARGGRRQEAQKILSEMLVNRTYSRGSFGIGVVYAGLRDYDRAFQWLEKGVEEAQSTQYKLDPMLEDIQRDQRFRRINLYVAFQKR